MESPSSHPSDGGWLETLNPVGEYDPAVLRWRREQAVLKKLRDEEQETSADK